MSLKNCCLRTEVVAEAEPLERRAIDENDLRLDVHLRLAQIEALGVLLELGQRRRDVGDADALVIVSAVTVPRVGQVMLCTPLGRLLRLRRLATCAAAACDGRWAVRVSRAATIGCTRRARASS